MVSNLEAMASNLISSFLLPVVMPGATFVAMPLLLAMASLDRVGTRVRLQRSPCTYWAVHFNKRRQCA